MELLTFKIYGPRVSHIRSINVVEHKNNERSFCEKFTSLKLINRERMTIKG